MAIAYDKNERPTTPAIVRHYVEHESWGGSKPALAGAAISVWSVESAKDGAAALARAESSGYKVYQVIDDVSGKPLAAANIDEKGSFGGFYREPLSSRLHNAMNLAEDILSTEKGVYEPRILHIQRTQAYALWLHDAKIEQSDRFIPLTNPVHVTGAMASPAVVNDITGYRSSNKTPSPDVWFEPGYMENAAKLEKKLQKAEFRHAFGTIAGFVAILGATYAVAPVLKWIERRKGKTPNP